MFFRLTSLAAALTLTTLPATGQTLLAGNHSIDGALCVGFECTISEIYPIYTNMKFKDFTLRILFEDTSADPMYATRDWAIQANDFNGNIPFFGVEDVDAGFYPFKIEGDARANALYVAQTGNIGLGTSLPESDIHMVSTNTPGMKFEQTGAGGQTPYEWDMFGNEFQFAVLNRTATDANSGVGVFPFRITAPAEHATLDLGGGGRIGMSTENPQAQLHLLRSDGGAKVLVEETAAATSARTLLELKNSGRPEIVMANVSNGDEWSFGAGTKFILKTGAVGSATSAKTKVFEIDASGNATLLGALTTGGGTCGGGCDAVFTERQIIPAADYASQMWDQGHLPHVGATPEGAPINVSEKLGGMLNALEHAHIYIDRQQDMIGTLQAQVATLEARLSALEKDTPD